MCTLVFLTLGCVAALAGCGSGEESSSAPAETAKQPPPAETAQAKTMEGTQAADEKSGRTATVRLSGTEGTVYAGNYGNLDGSEYAEGILEGKPVELTVDLRDSGFDVVNASFVKPNTANDGTLKVEIVSNGNVVAEQEAENQYGALNLTWSSEG